MRPRCVAIGGLVALGATLGGSPAWSQSVQEFENVMAGNWIVSPGPASENKACKLVLAKEHKHHGQSISANNCHGPLGNAVEWGIVQKQLAIYNTEGKVIVALGGNQGRLSGKTSKGQPLEMLRPRLAAAARPVVKGSDPTTTLSQLEHAFSGGWIVQDSSAPQSKCTLNLKLAGSSQQFAVQNTGCSGELARVVGWSIVKGQLALRNAKGEDFALLGGNEFRLSGRTTGGSPIVLARAKAPPVAPKAGGHCIYLGYTAACAQPSDLSAPRIPADGSASVAVLVKLNLRIRPETTAPVVRIIAPNTCVATDRCKQRPDGLWCHAHISGVDGWIKKEVVRLHRWRVLAFSNRCL